MATAQVLNHPAFRRLGSNGGRLGGKKIVAPGKPAPDNLLEPVPVAYPMSGLFTRAEVRQL